MFSAQIVQGAIGSLVAHIPTQGSSPVKIHLDNFQIVQILYIREISPKMALFATRIDFLDIGYRFYPLGRDSHTNVRPGNIKTVVMD